MKFFWPLGMPAKQQIFDSFSIFRSQKRAEAKIYVRNSERPIRVSETSSNFPLAVAWGGGWRLGREGGRDWDGLGVWILLCDRSLRLLLGF